MLIKENDFYTALYTMEGLTAWIKTAENESSLTGNIDTVVTELIITKENTKEIVFKKISYGSYICFYNTKGYNNIVDTIEDILLYLANSNDDMDLDVLTNLLQSYTSQPSMDGPVQNILTSMGMAIPPSKEK